MDRATRSGLVNHQGVAGLERVQGGAQLGAFAPGAGGLRDHLVAVRDRDRIQLHLMVLKAGTRPGVADPDGFAVIRGAHPAIVPELKRSTMVAGRVSGLCRLGGCDAIKTVPNTTDSETLRQCPSAPRTGRTPAESTLRSSRNTGLSPDSTQVTLSPW